MKPLSQVYIYILVTLAVALSQKDSDEGRPYEFGFTIDGQQHRHEKKDQNGIVQGEFGFITADGVYHVTVYATDENGNFKILSMRNLRISAPLDGSPATGPISPDAEKYLGKQKQIEPPKVIPTQPTVQLNTNQVPQSSQSVQVVTQKPVSYVFTTQSTIKPACGGCGYVTTQKPLSDQSFQFQNPAFKEPASPASNIGGVPPASTQQAVSSIGPVPPVPFNDNYNQPPTSTGIGIQQGTPNYNPPQTNVGAHVQQGISNYSPQPAGLGTGVQQGVSNYSPQPASIGTGIQQGASSFASTTAKNELPTEVNQNPQNLPNQQYFQNSPGVELLPPGVNGQTQEAFFSQPQQFGAESGPQYPQIPPVEKYQPGGNIVPNTGFGPEPNAFLQPQGQTSKLPPITVSDNTIHVGGSKPQDIPIKDKYPGMSDGLPNGIEEKDIKDLLYKFHYTVGFHGHYEKGLKNGAKIGGYFVNGRDGISRVVTYVADENGYRPKFKFINLGLDSEDTPKEGTEKKFGLKSFEFVWYPIE